ncbi:DUF2662 domain-containing protein, partial [Streptomyces sp. NPDC001273]
AARHGYEWAGPLAVHVRRSAEVPNGRYRVATLGLSSGLPFGVSDSTRSFRA